MYVTPARFRTLGTGLDLSGKTDIELASILYAAANLVNGACNAPVGYSFLGGHVDLEEHLWQVGNAYKRPSGRIWPYMRPVRSVDSLRINVTRSQYIDFNDQQLFTELSLGYTEPVAAPNTTALFTSVPPWLLTSPVSYVSYDYGFDFTMEDELLATASGDTFQAANQFWFTDEDVELKKNGTVVPTADYTVDYDEGTITPDTPPAGEVWKVSYHYHCPPGVAAATALVATDLMGQAALVASGMLGLSGLRVEEVEIRQSSKVNFMVNPVSPAARVYLGPYAAMFVSMR